MAAETVQTTIGIVEILQLAGLSAIIGGVTSAVVTFLVNMKELSRKRHMVFAEEKIELYSHFIFHLDSMRYKGEAIKILKNDTSNSQELYAYSDTELQEKIKLIDMQIMDKYHLLTPEILKSWVFVKTLYADTRVKEHIQNLRQLLVNEYNDRIAPEYEKLVNDSINRIEKIP